MQMTNEEMEVVRAAVEVLKRVALTRSGRDYKDRLQIDLNVQVEPNYEALASGGSYPLKAKVEWRAALGGEWLHIQRHPDLTTAIERAFSDTEENKTLRRIEDLKNRLKQERSTLRKAYRRG